MKKLKNDFGLTIDRKISKVFQLKNAKKIRWRNEILIGLSTVFFFLLN